MTSALCALALIYVFLLLLRRRLASLYAKSLPPIPALPPAPDTLTILQAILSGDPLLETRLAANLQHLQDQRFIWLVDEGDAEAARIAAKLQHPRLHVETCPPCPDATNPKLWKLRIAAGLVQTPFFAVVDDDTTLPAASAAALIEAAKTHAVATGLPSYQDSGDLASGLLAQFVNNNSAFTYLGTSKLLPPFTLNGMGYVMRREELVRIENFSPILNELTDDLALATLVLKRGGAIHQSGAVLHVQTGVRDFTHYWQMMHRWYVFTLLLLQRQRIPVQMIIFVLHGLPPLLLVAMFVLTLALHSGTALLILAAVIGLRQWVIVSTLGRFFGNTKLCRHGCSILSELVQPLHLIHSLACRTIRWRTRLYRVRDTNDFSAA